MQSSRTLVAVILGTLLGLTPAWASNEDECRIWCSANENCEKCSKLPACGVGYKNLKSFRGRGQNWYACESNSYGEASRANQSECQNWCDENDACEKCSEHSACGAGYKSIKKFGGRGKNWYACQSNSWGQASSGNQQECEAWCREQSNCKKCSKLPACGSGYKAIKTFGGRGKNWYACELNQYGSASVDNRQECEQWCRENDSCDKCSESLGCGADYKMIKTFGGRGKNWYACKKRKDRREDCLAWCAQSDLCDHCSKERSCEAGHTMIEHFTDGLGPSYYACGNVEQLRNRFRGECEAFCSARNDCTGCVQGACPHCALRGFGDGIGSAAFKYAACCRERPRAEAATERTPESHEIKETTRRIYLERQQIYEGNVPYLARFPSMGTIDEGRLLSLKLPSNAALSGIIHVSFVRAGESTTDCNRTASIVTLNPGDETSTSDLDAIFGSESPSLPIGLLACGLNSGSTPVNRIPIDVRYSYRD